MNIFNFLTIPVYKNFYKGLFIWSYNSNMLIIIEYVIIKICIS